MFRKNRISIEPNSGLGVTIVLNFRPKLNIDIQPTGDRYQFGLSIY